MREGLTPSASQSSGIVGRTRARVFVPEALACVAMLARAVGPTGVVYGQVKNPSRVEK